jgi:glycosyltransferase involved in cell wall biosynthesis
MEIMENKQTLDHTFVVCAYKESPYLEACVDSLLAQTARSRILIATSTDNEHIRRIAGSRGLEVFFSARPSDIAGDWNYAYTRAGTRYVTIAHQDDIYEPDYALTAVSMMENRKKPLLFFSDYYELRDQEKVYQNVNLRIKKLLMLPARIPFLSGKKACKRAMLSVGNPICCPSVTYARENLPRALFRKGMKSNIDWQAWLRAARMNGSFVYLPEPLMGHRIHAGSTTSGMIADSGRSKEDLDMLRSIWPEPVAKIIGRIYKYAEDSNG